MRKTGLPSGAWVSRRGVLIAVGVMVGLGSLMFVIFAGSAELWRQISQAEPQRVSSHVAREERGVPLERSPVGVLVLDARGRAVEGAKVQCGWTSALHATGPDGRCVLPRIPTATRMRSRHMVNALEASTSRYGTTSVRVDQAGDEPVVVTLDRWRIAGKVVDQASLPIPGAVVTCGTSAECDRQGDYDLVVGADVVGTARVSVAALGHVGWEGTVGDLLSESAVQLRSLPRIVLELHTEDGVPVDALHVVSETSGLGSSGAWMQVRGEPWAMSASVVQASQRSNPSLVWMRIRSRWVRRLTPTRAIVYVPFQGDTYLTLTSSTHLPTSLQVSASSFVEGDVKVTATLQSLSRGRRTVLLTDQDGHPLPPCKVYVQENRMGLAQKTYLSSKSDDRGVLDITSLPRGGERVLITLTTIARTTPRLRFQPRFWVVGSSDKIVFEKH